MVWSPAGAIVSRRRTGAGRPPCRGAGPSCNAILGNPIAGDIEPASPHRRATHTATGSGLPDNRSNIRVHRGCLRALRTSLPAHRTCIPARRGHTPPSSPALTRHAAVAFRLFGRAYRTMRDAFRLAEVTAAHIASAFPTIASPLIRARKGLRVNGLQVHSSPAVTAAGREGYSRDSGGSWRDSECSRRGW